MINSLLQLEKDIIEKSQNITYVEDGCMKEDVVTLLSGLGDSESSIGKVSELQWVCNAIVRWKHYLSDRWGVSNNTKIPDIDNIVELHDDLLLAEDKTKPRYSAYSLEAKTSSVTMPDYLQDVIKEWEKKYDESNKQLREINDNLQKHGKEVSIALKQEQKFYLVDEYGNPIGTAKRDQIRLVYGSTSNKAS